MTSLILSTLITLIFAFILYSIVRAYGSDIRYGQQKFNDKLAAFAPKATNQTFSRK